MQNKAVRPLAFSLIVVAALALLPIAGCGSGGGSSPTPIPTATPLVNPLPVLASTIPSTSESGVTTFATYDGTNKAVITVSFSVNSPDPTTRVAEYHLFRGSVLVARFTADQVAAQASPTTHLSTLTFADAGSAAPISYQRAATDQSQLETVQSAGAGPFAERTPIIYRITLLAKRDASSNYEETPTARSNSITPFR